jgi:hypothetical protein
MCEREVLGHAVALVDVQAQMAVPGQQCVRHGRRAASSKRALVQAEGLFHLAPHEATDDRDAQQPVELGRRHLVVDALLELDPEARH